MILKIWIKKYRFCINWRLTLITTGAGQNFKGLHIGKLIPIHVIHVNELKSLEKYTDGVDVFVKSVSKKFPYGKSEMDVSAIEIAARPLKLGLIDRLFGRKTVKSYFPAGVLRPLIEFNDTLENLFIKTVEKVKKAKK